MGGLTSETATGFRSRRGRCREPTPVTAHNAPFASYKTARFRHPSRRSSGVAAGGARAVLYEGNELQRADPVRLVRSAISSGVKPPVTLSGVFPFGGGPSTRLKRGRDAFFRAGGGIMSRGSDHRSERVVQMQRTVGVTFRGLPGTETRHPQIPAQAHRNRVNRVGEKFQMPEGASVLGRTSDGLLVVMDGLLVVIGDPRTDYAPRVPLSKC